MSDRRWTFRKMLVVASAVGLMMWVVLYVFFDWLWQEIAAGRLW